MIDVYLFMLILIISSLVMIPISRKKPFYIIPLLIVIIIMIVIILKMPHHELIPIKTYEETTKYQGEYSHGDVIIKSDSTIIVSKKVTTYEKIYDETFLFGKVFKRFTSQAHDYTGYIIEIVEED